VLATTHPWSGPRHSCTPAGFWQTARLHSVHCPISYPVDASRYLVGMWLDLTTSHRQTWFISSTSTCHSTDLLTARGVAHLVVHETSGSTSYETIPHVRGVLSTVDMVVLRDHDDDDGEIAGVHGKANAAGAGAVPCHTNQRLHGASVHAGDKNLLHCIAPPLSEQCIFHYSACLLIRHGLYSQRIQRTNLPLRTTVPRI